MMLLPSLFTLATSAAATPCATQTDMLSAGYDFRYGNVWLKRPDTCDPGVRAAIMMTPPVTNISTDAQSSIRSIRSGLDDDNTYSTFSFLDHVREQTAMQLNTYDDAAGITLGSDATAFTGFGCTTSSGNPTALNCSAPFDQACFQAGHYMNATIVWISIRTLEFNCNTPNGSHVNCSGGASLPTARPTDAFRRDLEALPEPICPAAAAHCRPNTTADHAKYLAFFGTYGTHYQPTLAWGIRASQIEFGTCDSTGTACTVSKDWTYGDVHANWSTSSTVITQELAPLSQYISRFVSAPSVLNVSADKQDALNGLTKAMGDALSSAAVCHGACSQLVNQEHCFNDSRFSQVATAAIAAAVGLTVGAAVIVIIKRGGRQDKWGSSAGGGNPGSINEADRLLPGNSDQR